MVLVPKWITIFFSLIPESWFLLYEKLLADTVLSSE